MRLGCFLIVVTLGLLVFGVQAIRDAAAFQKPKVMQFDEFVKSPPKEGWFQLKGCVLEVPDAAYKTYSKSADSISEAYIPVYSEAQMKRRESEETGAGEKSTLVLATEDEAVLGTLRELKNLDSASLSEAQVEEFISKNRDRLWVRKDLEGMIRAGVNSDDSTREKIAGLTESLRSDFLVMQEGWKPNLGMGIGMVIGGVVMVLITAVVLLGMFRGRE